MAIDCSWLLSFSFYAPSIDHHPWPAEPSLSEIDSIIAKRKNSMFANPVEAMDACAMDHAVWANVLFCL